MPHPDDLAAAASVGFTISPTSGLHLDDDRARPLAEVTPYLVRLCAAVGSRLDLGPLEGVQLTAAEATAALVLEPGLGGLPVTRALLSPGFTDPAVLAARLAEEDR